MAESVSGTEWWHKCIDFLLPGYRDYIETEAHAAVVQVFCAAVVPGLLQTERYARMVTQQVASHTFSTEWIDMLTEIRMTRQWHQLDKDPAPRMDYVIDESVLYRRFGNAEVLREQLQHLLGVSEHPYITLRVLPFEKTIEYFHLSTDFTVFTSGFSSLDKAVAYSDDTFERVIRYNDPAKISMYKLAFHMLRLQALDPEDTQQKIRQALSKIEDHTIPNPEWQRKRNAA